MICVSFPNIQCRHSGGLNGRAGREAFTRTLLDNGVSFSARSVCLRVHVGLHACGGVHYSRGLHGVVCKCLCPCDIWDIPCSTVLLVV